MIVTSQQFRRGVVKTQTTTMTRTPVTEGGRGAAEKSRFRMTAQPQYRRLLALQREIRKIRRGRRGRLRPERMTKMIS